MTMVRPTDNFGRLHDESAFTVLARATALERQGRDIINLGIGQPDFPTPQHIVDAATRALRDGHHGYTPANGILPLREAISHSLGQRFGVDVSPEQLLIVPGGKFAIFTAIQMFGEPGVEIIHPDPCFPIYRSIVEFTGATPIPLPMREDHGFAFSAQEALSLINERTRMIIINSPANPTGGVTPKKELDLLVAGLERYERVAILSDEIYGAMTYDGQRHISLLSYPSIRDRLIHLDGVSKSYAMTGWRLGWSSWPANLYDSAYRLAINSYSCVSSISQWAAIAALNGPQACVTAMVAEFDTRRRLVVESLNGLPGMSCVMPSGAFFAFPNVTGTGWQANALARALLEEAGVAVIAGPDFGTYGKGHLRVSYASSAKNLKRAADRIGEFLSG